MIILTTIRISQHTKTHINGELNNHRVRFSLEKSAKRKVYLVKLKSKLLGDVMEK